jgi:hypothetical protein
MSTDSDAAIKEIDDVLATQVSSGREGVAQQVSMFAACIERLTPAESPYRGVIQQAKSTPRERGISYPATLLQGALKGLREDLRAGRVVPSAAPNGARPVDSQGPATPDQVLENPIGGFVGAYGKRVREKHPQDAVKWPLINGNAYNHRHGLYQGQWVVLFEDRFGQGRIHGVGLGEINRGLVGMDLNDETREAVRQALSDAFQMKERDAVVLLWRDGHNMASEVEALLDRHEVAMGITKMRIFLSHKGSDKPRVRRFKAVLEQLGFDPWLDEDAMVAGEEVNRAILKGMKDSCAAVFFVTESFKDETWIGDEVDYAKDRKREDGDRFSIITLVMGDHEANIPDLLRKYVYKKPETDLDALREMLRALPIVVGPVRRRT